MIVGTGMRGRNRWVFRFAILAAAGLAWFAWMNREKSQQVMTIANQSNQPIKLLKVTVAGRTNSYRDLAMGAEVNAPLESSGDDRFVMEAQLADGLMVRHQGSCKAGVQTIVLVLPEGRIAVRQAGKN
jgi:hypothetical protein